MVNGENSEETIAIANAILREYQLGGDSLTLRQLYYQFVARGYLTENSQRNYKNLGGLITAGRDRGLVSWNAIVDRGRGVSRNYYEEDDHEVVNNLEALLSIDRWARQDTYVEVWVEKDALSQVIARACQPLHVPFMATKGYLSASEAWRAGQRFEEKRDEGKRVVMLHLGDHDPEGIDMTRDNGDRLEKYSGWESVEVQRLALNMDQVLEHNPPPNYAKASSSRFEGYVDQFGEECWELDALEPATIRQVIRDQIREFIDPDKWEEAEDEEKEKREHLSKLWEHWDSIKDFIDEID